MVTSYGETSGFSVVGAEELLLVNGGKGSSESDSSGVPTYVDPAYGDYPKNDRPYDSNGQTNPNSPLNSSDSSSGSSSK